MSKMMDNLARVQDEQPEAAPARPSLFVVTQQPAGSTAVSNLPPRGRTAAIWAVVSLLISGLVASYFLLPQGPSPAESGQRVASVDPGNGALEALREGRLNDAKAGFESLLRASPGNSAALANQAFVLKELGRFEEAETALQALVGKSPKNAVALNNLGALQLRTGRLAEAEATLRRAVSMEPSLLEARVNLAGVLEGKRDWPGALRIFEEILEKNEAGDRAALVRERVRRLRSLAVASLTPKEKL